MAQAMPNNEPTATRAEQVLANPRIRKLIAEDAAKSRPDPKLLSKEEFLARLNATV